MPSATRRRPGGAAFRSYARAMQVVGAVATVYHASSGPVRPYLRKADYYSIALSAAMLRRLLVGRLPRAASAAMLAVLPVKPTFVTVGNLAAVEVSGRAGGGPSKGACAGGNCLGGHVAAVRRVYSTPGRNEAQPQA